MPLADLLAGHRIALARLQELLIARSAGWADTAEDAAEGLALMSSFSEALIPRMTAAHAAGARLRAETLEATRLAAIRTVLTGGPIDEARLGIRAARSHIAVAASGPAADRLGVILRAANVGAVLVAAPIPQTSWAWCDSGRLRLETLNGLGGWVGVGQPALGVAGFIASHQQALLALEVGSRGPVRTVRYEDVAVQALVWGGAAAAEQLVAHALGGLAAPSGRARSVRVTLAAWLECACSAAKPRGGCTCPSAPCATTSSTPPISVADRSTKTSPRSPQHCASRISCPARTDVSCIYPRARGGVRRPANAQ